MPEQQGSSSPFAGSPVTTLSSSILNHQKPKRMCKGVRCASHSTRTRVCVPTGTHLEGKNTQQKDTRAGEGSLSCGWHDQNNRTLFRVMLERPPAAQ